jgi:Dis3-like cold-shock domain 2 (CSD2)
VLISRVYCTHGQSGFVSCRDIFHLCLLRRSLLSTTHHPASPPVSLTTHDPSLSLSLSLTHTHTQRLLVSVDHWPADSLSPLGHYVRVLGKDGDKDVETQVDHSCVVFTPIVLSPLPLVHPLSSPSPPSTFTLHLPSPLLFSSPDSPSFTISPSPPLSF